MYERSRDVLISGDGVANRVSGFATPSPASVREALMSRGNEREREREERLSGAAKRDYERQTLSASLIALSIKLLATVASRGMRLIVRRATRHFTRISGYPLGEGGDLNQRNRTVFQLRGESVMQIAPSTSATDLRRVPNDGAEGAEGSREFLRDYVTKDTL